MSEQRNNVDCSFSRNSFFLECPNGRDHTISASVHFRAFFFRFCVRSSSYLLVSSNLGSWQITPPLSSHLSTSMYLSIDSIYMPPSLYLSLYPFLLCPKGPGSQCYWVTQHAPFSRIRYRNWTPCMDPTPTCLFPRSV